MIYERDLDEAIAECLGERNPSANTCIKLASYYALKNRLYPPAEQDPGNLERTTYSYSPPQREEDSIVDTSEISSDFGRLIDGRKQSEIWPVIDELISTIQILQPRLYDAVIKRFK